MTLKRLLITVLVLLALTGGMIAFMWEYAYSPKGRARTIFCELRNETTGFRPWLIRNGIIREEVGAVRRLVDSRHVNSLLCKASGMRLASLGPDVIPIVIGALKDKDSGVRRAAAIACGKLKDKRAVKPLVACLQTADSPSKECYDSLGEIGGPEACASLVEVFNSSNNGDFYQCRIVDALGRCADSSVTPMLLDEVGKDENRDIHLLRAVSRIQFRCGIDPRYQAQVAGLIAPKRVNGYWHEHACIRSIIKASYGDPKAKASLQKLIEYAKEDSSWGGPDNTAAILYNAGIEEGLDIILSKIESKSAGIRRTAVGAVDCVRAIPALVKAMNDPEWNVRFAAADSLGQIPNAPTAPLKILLRDSSQPVRWAAFYALVCLGSQEDWRQYDIEPATFH